MVGSPGLEPRKPVYQTDMITNFITILLKAANMFPCVYELNGLAIAETRFVLAAILYRHSFSFFHPYNKKPRRAFAFRGSGGGREIKSHNNHPLQSPETGNRRFPLFSSKSLCICAHTNSNFCYFLSIYHLITFFQSSFKKIPIFFSNRSQCER